MREGPGMMCGMRPGVSMFLSCPRYAQPAPYDLLCPQRRFRLRGREGGGGGLVHHCFFLVARVTCRLSGIRVAPSRTRHSRAASDSLGCSPLPPSPDNEHLPTDRAVKCPVRLPSPSLAALGCLLKCRRRRPEKGPKLSPAQHPPSQDAIVLAVPDFCPPTTRPFLSRLLLDLFCVPAGCGPISHFLWGRLAFLHM
jgi:hypothetical protein